MDDDGRVTGMVEVTRNITESKAALSALEESEARLRAIFDTARDVVFIKDRQGQYVMVNPVF